MSKLKIYNQSTASQAQLNSDMHGTIDKLDRMGAEAAAGWEGKNAIYLRDSYTNDLKALVQDTDADISTQEHLFKQFSKFIDGKYENLLKTTIKDKIEKDLMKYQALCVMESHLFSSLAKEGSEAAKTYIDASNKVNRSLSIADQFKQDQDIFKQFIDKYKSECEVIPGNEAYKDIAKIHNQVLGTYDNLSKNIEPQEKFSITNLIEKKDTETTNIGKYSLWDKVSDMIGKILAPINSIFSKLGDLFSGEKEQIIPLLKETASKMGPPPPVPTAKIQQTALSTEVMSREITEPMPRNSEEDMKMWGPPPPIPTITSDIKQEALKAAKPTKLDKLISERENRSKSTTSVDELVR